LLLSVAIAGAGTLFLLVGLGFVGERGGSGMGADGASATASHAGAVPATASPARPARSPDGATDSPPRDPVLVGAGDIGRCDSEDDDATAALVERLPGIVFTLGDNAYERGSPDEFRDCFGPSWGRLRDRIELPAPGNHDHETDGALGYRDYFGAVAVRDGTTWYSREVGAWHVVVVDSTCAKVEGGCGPGSPQLEWLRTDLAASGSRCTLAIVHHPRFSSGDHGSDASVAPFWDVLHAAGADLVLSGHEHDYERFGPQDPAGRADPEGLTQLIVGTGGAPLRGFREPVANSRVRASLAHGVLSLTLRPSGWAFRFETVDGSFTDEGAAACH
jgi:alkaline phosphatase